MAKTSKCPAAYPIRASKTWGCKVKLPDKTRLPVSLRLPWPGNVGQAKDRAAELQREVDAKHLSESLKWLGEKSAETLKLRLGLKPIASDDEIRPIAGVPTTWWEARSAWLCSYPDRKVVTGKVHDIDLTKIGYAQRSRQFCRWAEEVGIPYGKVTATTLALRYLRARRAGESSASKGKVSLGTMDGDIRNLSVWWGWMHRRGWIDLIDKETVYDDAIFADDDEAGHNFIPDWRTDLNTLEVMHKARFDNEANFAGWRLFVLVRGLGCRPKEAITLSWDTVNLAEGIVVFKNTKEEKLKARRRGRGGSRRANRDRPVPIIFQWVHDALDEMRRLGAVRGSAVALNTDGGYHQGLGQSANAYGRTARDLGIYRPGYGLKACQRAGLMHLEQVLPPWVVAKMAGHGLGIHMAHYSTNDSHVSMLKERSMGRFDVLTSAGKMVAEKYQQPALLRTLMSQGEV